MLNELVVISGKGGTGKTSVLASFASLAENAVLADCDVDAADLHLILAPQTERTEAFFSGREAQIRQDDCLLCGLCAGICRYDVIEKVMDGDKHLGYKVNPFSCEGCGCCVEVCPANAIDFEDRRCGDWFVSTTAHGPMVHARLDIAAENSGKLVSTVRQEARKLALQRGKDMLLIDGPPGIGCPVIASITGASAVLIVTEPTFSGRHDMERVLELTKHFDIPAMICVNKWDLNPDVTQQIEAHATESGCRSVGRISYDKGVTQAQLKALPVVETDCKAADEIRSVWNTTKEQLNDT